MLVYSLEIPESSCSEYSLIAIHTALEDYKLAYLLNKQLSLFLEKASFSLDFQKKNISTSYTVYEFEDKKLDNTWFLISNIFKTKMKPKKIELFNESETQLYLIPEKKKVDFFLKLDDRILNDHISDVIEKINQIPQIITSYIIKTNTLKSKDFLIF